MSQPIIVSRDSLQRMLDQASPEKRVHIVGRALVALFERQTQSEQADNTTKELNDVGFTGGDAIGGSLTAKYYLKYNTLQQWQVDRWIKRGKNQYARLAKYHKQLNEVAVEKVRKANPELVGYVNQINFNARVFGRFEVDMFDKDDREVIRQHLEADISPENLSHDGELPHETVQQRYQALKVIEQQLNSLKW